MFPSLQRAAFCLPPLARRLSLFTLLLLFLPACGGGGGGYQIRGAVVEGETPAVLVVGKNDSRLTQNGIPGAVVDIIVDPNERQKPLAPVQTDGDGQFAATTTAPGAGMLEYQMSVLARAGGHQSIEEVLKMPGGNKRLLIVLAPGRDINSPTRDVLRETMRMKDEIEKQ